MWPRQSQSCEWLRLLRFARNDQEHNPLQKRSLCSARELSHTRRTRLFHVDAYMRECVDASSHVPIPARRHAVRENPIRGEPTRFPCVFSCYENKNIDTDLHGINTVSFFSRVNRC